MSQNSICPLFMYKPLLQILMQLLHNHENENKNTDTEATLNQAWLCLSTRVTKHPLFTGHVLFLCPILGVRGFL